MHGWASVPNGETDDAHITPERFLAYQAGRLAAGGKEPQTVHPVVLLTFQAAIAAQFVQETHARAVGNGFSTESVSPLYRGTLGGLPVSIQKLPIGAPAAAIAFELLIASGGQTFLLAGTAGSLTPALPIGSVLLPTGARREEGTSYHYLPPEADPRPDAALLDLLRVAAARRMVAPAPLEGRVWTTDAVYREMGWKVRQYAQEGVLAVEMELSALLAIAQVRGVHLAAVLVISDELYRPWNPGFHSEAFAAGRRLTTNLALDAAAAFQVGGTKYRVPSAE